MRFPQVFEKPGFRHFVLATCLFCLFFIIISFIVGGTIVPGPLLYQLWFSVYGGLGYILLAMAIFFVVYARMKLIAIKPFGRGHWSLWILTAVLVTAFRIIAAYVQLSPEILIGREIIWAVILHSIFILMFISLGFAVFPLSFVKRFFKDFRKELLVCFAISVAFYAAMWFVWQLWPLLSWGVLKIVYQLLRAYPGNPVLIPPQSLQVGSFTVLIGEACSGVFSIFLFTALYLLIIALDWQKLNHKKAVGMFFCAVAGLYLVNALRVYLIILVGALYSPDFAANLFHSYIGMILFMVYFAVFMWLCYDWIKA